MQSGLRPLTDELDAKATWIESVHGIGVASGELSKLGLEVELIERRVDLIKERLAVLALEPGNVILAGLVVRRQRDDALKAFILSVSAHGFGPLVVLRVGLEIKRATLRAGDRRGA